VRRYLAGFAAFTALAGTILVLPVYAAPVPAAHPVEASVDEVALGSVVDPAADAVVATDGEVLPGGVDEPAAAPEPAPAEEPAAAEEPAVEPSEEPAAEGEPAVSGQELPGVPALTVSQPDTDRFSSVGVTWQEDPAIVDVRVQLRTKDADGNWGDWTTLTADDVEQSQTDETADHPIRSGTAPYWTGDSYGIEVIVQGADGSVPQDVTLTMIDPGESPADAIPAEGPQDQAHAAEAMPPVITRAQWGADPNLMGWDPEYASTIKAATIHHTADGNNYTAAQVAGIMRSMYYYHSVTRGWGDIGYNVIVDKFGRIFEGRAGGLTSTVVGAHAGGFNTYTFGVSMLGNYDITPVPQATVTAVEDIIAWKLALYDVDPNGTTVLTSGGGGTAKYGAGVRVTLPTIFAHRDVGSTVCPGQYGYSRMNEIRAAVAGRSGNAAYVQALYADMMTRVADPVGLSGWTSALSSGAADRRSISRGFSNSYEYRMLAIRTAYQQVFNRAPDPAGISTWMTALNNGSVRPDALRPIFMGSAEFYLRGGSSDAAFVDNLYMASLNRHAGAGEIAYWADVRRRQGPGAVIGAVYNSAEAGMRRVDQIYSYYLGRSAGRAEQESWLSMLLNRGDEAVREELVISTEYFLRAKARFPTP
jgi:N-acetylmuramoyl-L-alanine amidase/Domain of unknown function (DUF4214)